MREVIKTEITKQYTRKKKDKENKQSGRTAELSASIEESKTVIKNTIIEKEKLAARLKFYKTSSLALPL